jgi:hypothetical protein
MLNRGFRVRVRRFLVWLKRPDVLYRLIFSILECPDEYLLAFINEGLVPGGNIFTPILIL